jgi:hypothetical protein
MTRKDNTAFIDLSAVMDRVAKAHQGVSDSILAHAERHHAEREENRTKLQLEKGLSSGDGKSYPSV